MLREYQSKSEQDIFNAWKEHRRLMYQLPTGGGKTVVITSIIRKILAQNLRVMFIAHREELIAQAWQTFYKNKIYSGIIKSGVKPNYALPCQVASIQTIARRDSLPAANVIFIDEAHHALDDNSYGVTIAKHYPNALVLGVTGTPYRLSGKGFTAMFDTLIESVQLKDLIDMGYLVPLRYFVSSIPDLSKIKVVKGDYQEAESMEAMRLAPIVESYLEHCSGMSGMVFAVNVEHSIKIISQYVKSGIKAAHIDANTPPDLRREIINKFKGGDIKVVSNVGIATEGFDFPNMEFVQLARPTKSLSLFYQMVGRVTRADHETIKDATSDEHRKFLISCSKKSCGIVLDNAGLWQDHGLPDVPQDWQRFFRGYDKKKKKVNEMIDLIEFVAEDESGRRVTSKIPKEIEGMKLIEINHTQREKIVNLLSLKEFDRLLELYKRLPRMNKPAMVAVFDYIKYCKKNNFLMTEEVWNYLLQRSSKDPQIEFEKEENFRDRTVDQISQSYAHNPQERDNLIAQVKRKSDEKLSKIKRGLVNQGFLTKQKYEYFETINAIA